MKSKLSVFFLLAGGASLLWFNAGCDLLTGANADSGTESPEAEADALTEKTSSKVGSILDAPLAAFQNDLLDIAFETATAIPKTPHLKDRSRAQEAVAAACFELDQPRRALRYIEGVADWRRGAGYADFAFYCAQHGDTSEVPLYLNLAGQIAESAEDWRQDRIRVKIARTHALLGNVEQAAQFEANVADSEAGKVDGVRAMLVDEGAFDEQIAALDAVISTGNFDLMRNALETCAHLFNRFYADQQRRALMEEKVKSSSSKLPVIIRIELIMELVGFALKHEDRAKALELVNEAWLITDQHKWEPESHVPLMARLAALRYRAGATQAARGEVDAALALFHDERDRIVNIYRAEALHPLAEAYQLMGDTAAALMVYKNAVAEGVENRNSRPRAEDLSATCSSMAVHGVEPDAELWSRIREIRGGLGHPW